MHIITQGVIPAHTVVKRHLVFQTEELAVNRLSHHYRLRYLNHYLQTSNPVFQTQVLMFSQRQRFTQRHHVVPCVVTQFSTRVAFRYHVEGQTVFATSGAASDSMLEAVT